MKNSIIFIFIILPILIFSQNIKLEGIVKSEANNPLEMANVIAFKKGTKFLQSYSITDSKGHYKLSLEQDQEYTLKVSYLGFDTKSVEIALNIEYA